MKAIGTFFTLFSIGMVVLLLAACSSPATSEPTLTATAISTSTLPPPSATQTLGLTLTITPSMDATQQTWYSTASVIQKTELAASQQYWDEQMTQIAEFSVDCETINPYLSEISPDGNWAAVSCGGQRDQTLIVQSRDSTKWTLKVEDFLVPETQEGITGFLGAKFWSPDKRYFFFKLGIQLEDIYEGPHYITSEYGDFALYRLDLKTGSWVTLIPSTDGPTEYEIEFSPTGRRYAATLDGITIRDLETGDSTNIPIMGFVEKIIWSPDGTQMAYSVTLFERMTLESSTVSVWDSATDSTKLIVQVDNQILKPEAWIDNQTLRIIGTGNNRNEIGYTIYQYDIHGGNLLFTGTATPYP